MPTGAAESTVNEAVTCPLEPRTAHAVETEKYGFGIPPPGVEEIVQELARVLNPDPATVTNWPEVPDAGVNTT